jgi:hypothetical protein
MKAIIDGKRYDTDTATLVAGISGGDGPRDFRWEDTGIYVTPKGNWFLSGEGGPLTRWARPCGSGSSGGSGIEAIDRDQARHYLEGLGETAAIEEYFADEIEDA